MQAARHLLACAALGVLLFGAEQALERPAPIALDPLRAVAAARAAGFAPEGRALGAFERSARDEALLAREARARGIGRGDAVVREALVRRAAFFAAPDASADERLGEARALGLDARDPVVERRLAATLAARVRAEAAAEPLAVGALRAWFEAHRERWMQPAALRLAHVFFAGPGAFERAAAARAAIERESLPPERAAQRGDPSLFGAELVASDPTQLAARLGEPLARAAFEAPVGVWIGPIASSHGAHLIRVRERSAARAPDFDAVAASVESAWRAERGDAALEALLARLRAEDARR